MKRKLMILLAVLLAAVLVPGLAGIAESAGEAEKQDGSLLFQGLSISPDTEILDFDEKGIQVTDAKALAEVLDRLPSLKEVRLFDSPMDTESMEWLFDRYYPDVFFGFTIQIGPHVIRTDQTAFSTMHHSSETKEDKFHTDEDMYPIRMCTRMKALDLGHNKLTNVNFLNWMPEIEVLIITPNRALTDISPVANCKNLVYLEAFNIPIPDLQALAGCTKLRDLNITRDGQITDLSPLYDLPCLERVWWGGMKQTKDLTAQKREMREKHPNCKFVSVYDPTSGGWRSHIRFREMRASFDAGEYTPFSK